MAALCVQFRPAGNQVLCLADLDEKQIAANTLFVCADGLARPRTNHKETLHLESWDKLEIVFEQLLKLI